MAFQKIVLTIAIVLLIICLIIIGVMLYNSKYTAKFPPVTGSCPDYWVNLGPNKDHDNKNMCVPPGYIDPKTGKEVSPAINGYGAPDASCNQPKYMANSGEMSSGELCENSRWAKKCGYSWGGVSGNANACKNSN